MGVEEGVPRGDAAVFPGALELLFFFAVALGLGEAIEGFAGGVADEGAFRMGFAEALEGGAVAFGLARVDVFEERELELVRFHLRG